MPTAYVSFHEAKRLTSNLDPVNLDAVRRGTLYSIILHSAPPVRLVYEDRVWGVRYASPFVVVKLLGITGTDLRRRETRFIYEQVRPRRRG